MTRSKKTPTVHKPPFDEESTLRFAEMEPPPPAGSMAPQPDRHPITLLLKAETIATLQHEAGRKEKAIDQIIDKLVAKHLGKHK